MSDLSNAPFTPPSQQPLSSYSVGGVPRFDNFSTTNGVQTTEGTAVSSQIGSAGMLVYPTDVPKYVMTFSVQQYHRSSYNSVGQYITAGYPGIVLPVPEQMSNLNESKWEQQDAGLMSLVAAGAQLVLGRAGARGGQARQAVQEAEALGGAIGGTVATNLEAFLGATPNQFQVMLYRGPTYKQHNFTWQLSPQNFKESDILRMMCLVFQNAMAPSIVGVGNIGFGQALWGFPCVFRIRLYPNSKWMYKFKPCVLTHFVVNYTPAGRPSFTRNVNGQPGENPPEAITIQAKFMEMEYWVAGNYSNINDPDDTDLNARIAQVGGEPPPAVITPSSGGGALL